MSGRNKIQILLNLTVVFCKPVAQQRPCGHTADDKRHHQHIPLLLHLIGHSDNIALRNRCDDTSQYLLFPVPFVHDRNYDLYIAAHLGDNAFLISFHDLQQFVRDIKLILIICHCVFYYFIITLYDNNPSMQARRQFIGLVGNRVGAVINQKIHSDNLTSQPLTLAYNSIDLLLFCLLAVGVV